MFCDCFPIFCKHLNHFFKKAYECVTRKSIQQKNAQIHKKKTTSDYTDILKRTHKTTQTLRVINKHNKY